MWQDGHQGKGGRVKHNLTVTPGQVLNIYVGGVPLLDTGGMELRRNRYNGGGSAYGGGGATDIDW